MKRYNNRNYKTTSIRVFHPEDGDVYVMVDIYFKFHYYHGEVPSESNPYGCPAEYDFELIKYSKSADWITEDLVQESMRKMDNSELYEEDYIEY